MLTNLTKCFRYLGFVGARNDRIRLFSSGKIILTNMERYHSDPVYRRRELDKSRERHKRRIARDSAYHEKMKAYYVAYTRRYRSQESYLRWRSFTDWLRRGWHEADLPWKLYRPELSAKSVVHRCSGCTLPDHRSKMWWYRISESESYLCSKCRAKLSWEELCPKGFESATSWKEFTARANELGITKPLNTGP